MLLSGIHIQLDSRLMRAGMTDSTESRSMYCTQLKYAIASPSLYESYL